LLFPFLFGRLSFSFMVERNDLPVTYLIFHT
jgi:hypothetical protein